MNKQRKYLLQHDEEPDDYVLLIDNSSMEKMTTCPRSAMFALIEGRTPPSRPPLIFGGAHHNGLEAHYKGKSDDEIVQAMTAEFDPNISMDWRTPELCLESMSDYIKKYKNETITPLLGQNNLPMVEIPFSIPIGTVEINGHLQFPPRKLVKDYRGDIEEQQLYVRNITIFWTGKIDAFMKEGRSIWVMDHKTSSIKGNTYYDNFELSHQTIGYTWAAEQILGEPVQGFLLNLIINRKPTKSGTGREFDRRKYFYPRYRIDEWPHDTLAVIDDMIHRLMQGVFPPARAWCTGKYGKCPYFDVCCGPPDTRMAVLHSSAFEDNTWSPLD